MQMNRLRLLNLFVRHSLGIGGFVLILAACTGSDLETVENRDASGNLERFERRKKDFAKQGRYQRFSPDGKLIEEAFFKNDSLDGERRLFFPNGAVDVVEHYSNGVFAGKYLKYAENGALLLEQPFVNGQIEGVSIGYYPNGQIAEKVTFRDSEENGPFTEYYENGQLKAEGAYVPDEDGPLEDGELKEYDSTGTLVRIADCRRGVCITRWKQE